MFDIEDTKITTKKTIRKESRIKEKELIIPTVK
jgi:hypothetical protein